MKKNYKGFTLMELVVVISIIGILVVGSSKINFNPQIDKQNSLLFLNNIFTTIEKIRNDSLLGKGVGDNLIYPEKWIISLGTGSNLNISYLSGTTTIPYKDLNINYINNFASISELKCFSIDKNSSITPLNVDIEITGSNLSLSGCSSPNYKILEITTKYKNFKNIIRLNTVSGVLEKN